MKQIFFRFYVYFPIYIVYVALINGAPMSLWHLGSNQLVKNMMKSFQQTETESEQQDIKASTFTEAQLKRVTKGFLQAEKNQMLLFFIKKLLNVLCLACNVLSFYLLFIHLDERLTYLGVDWKTNSIFEDHGKCRTSTYGSGGAIEHHLSSCTMPMMVYYRLILISLYYYFVFASILHAWSFLAQIFLIITCLESR